MLLREARLFQLDGFFSLCVLFLLLFFYCLVCKPWHTCVRGDDRCLNAVFGKVWKLYTGRMMMLLFCWLVSRSPRTEQKKKPFCFDMWHRFILFSLLFVSFLPNGIGCRQSYAKTCSCHQYSNVFLKIVSIRKVHFEIVSQRLNNIQIAHKIVAHSPLECALMRINVASYFYTHISKCGHHQHDKCNQIILRWISTHSIILTKSDTISN